MRGPTVVVAAVVIALGAACGGPQSGSGSSDGARSLPTPAEWRSCGDTSECVLVVDGTSHCCAGEYRAVNRAYQDRAVQIYSDPAGPPVLTCVDSCEAPRAECENGRCVAYPGIELDQ